MDWQRHEKNIRAKVEYWFEIIVKQLSERGVSQRNVYNMDETGVMLSDLDTVKVLIARGGKEQRRGRALKRTITTAIECVSVGGRVLPPLIIFPGTVLVQQAHGCLMRHPVCTIAAVRRAITIPHSAGTGWSTFLIRLHGGEPTADLLYSSWTALVLTNRWMW